MYYHFAILLLFRPLIKLRIIGSCVIPRDVCTQAADAIQGLLRSYAQLYTLRRTPSFVPYFVLTSTIMHLAAGSSKRDVSITSPGAESSLSTVKLEGTSRTSRGGRSHAGTSPASSRGHHGGRRGVDEPEAATSPSSTTTTTVTAGRLPARAAEALSQGISDLAEMAPCHHFAEQALSILRYLAKKWHVDVVIPRRNPASSAVVDNKGDGKDDGKEDGKDADADAEADADADADDDGDDVRVRPATSSLNFFVPNVVQTDFICNWGPGGSSGHGSKRRPAVPSQSQSQSQSRSQKQQQQQQQQQQQAGSGANDGGSGDGENSAADSRMGGMEVLEDMQRVVGSAAAAAASSSQSQPQLQPQPMGPGAGPGVGVAGTALPQSPDSFENPLFWPFPMQGRPMLPEGPLLREAGFEPL